MINNLHMQLSREVDKKWRNNRDSVIRVKTVPLLSSPVESSWYGKSCKTNQIVYKSGSRFSSEAQAAIQKYFI